MVRLENYLSFVVELITAITVNVNSLKIYQLRCWQLYNSELDTDSLCRKLLLLSEAAKVFAHSAVR